MNKLKLTAILFVMCAALAAKAAPPDNQVPPPAGRLVSDTVHGQALATNLLKDSADRSVLVYLPPSYDRLPQKRYPVVYLLHGNGGHNTSWTEGSHYQGLRIHLAMDALIAEGKLIEMIMVMPDVHNRYGGGHYANSLVTGNWADFISRDLITYVDKTYRTLAFPAARGLAGHSMGGRGTLYLAMKYPGVYGAIYAMSSGRMDFEDSPPFSNATWLRVLALGATGEAPPQLFGPLGFAASFSPNPDRIPLLMDFPFEMVQGDLKRIDRVWQKWLAHDPVALLQSYQASLRQLRAMQFDCGASDTMTVGANRTFSKALVAANIPHRYEEYDGDHNSRIGERVVARMLPFFSKELKVE
jgi:S-formylglutathione hydrolase